MISLGDITSFDVIVVVLFLLFIVRGTWIGFMRQVSFFLALVCSYLVAGQYTGSIMPYVGKFIENPKFVFFTGFLLLFIVGALVFILLGKVLHLVMQLTFAGWFDKLMGCILGVVKAVLVTSFLYMIMSSGPSSAHELVNKSVTSKYLARGAAFVQQLIRDHELRDRFVPKVPAIPQDTQATKPVPGPAEPGGEEDKPQQKSSIDTYLPGRTDK